jgi:hypothetical protein
MFDRWAVVVRDLNDKKFKIGIISRHWTHRSAQSFADNLQRTAFFEGKTHYFTVERLP